MPFMKRLWIILLAAALLLSGCSSQNKESESATDASAGSEAATTQSLLFVQSGDLNEAVFKTENFTYSKGEFVYLMAMFSSNLSYYGVDPYTSLKDQPYPDQENTSWYDVLLEEASDFAQEQLYLCEAAKAQGLTLEQEDLDYVAELKKSAQDNAQAQGWEIDTFFQQIYGTNIGWSQVESVLLKARLISKMEQQFLGKDYSEEELEKQFQAHLSYYGVIDYYSVSLSDGEGISDELLAQTKEAMTQADSLKAFTEALKAFLSAGKDASEIQAAGGIDAYTEQYLSKNLRTGVAYVESEFFDWAFGEESKEGETYIIDNLATNTPYAYFLVKKPYKDPSVTVDVRHILFLVGEEEGAYATAELARAKAEEIYNAWVSEGASEERFIELCAEYSADGNSQSGGLYTNVYVGQMVATFNDWCFDENRRTGDHGIVDTSYGSHMMYFVDSHQVWRENIINDLMNEAMEKILDKQKTISQMESFQAVIDSLVW